MYIYKRAQHRHTYKYALRSSCGKVLLLLNFNESNFQLIEKWSWVGLTKNIQMPIWARNWENIQSHQFEQHSLPHTHWLTINNQEAFSLFACDCEWASVFFIIISSSVVVATAVVRHRTVVGFVSVIVFYLFWLLGLGHKYVERIS